MKYILIIAISAFIICCSSPRRSEPIKKPLVFKTANVENGRMVFMAKCQKCHPGGESGQGPEINTIPLPGFMKRFRVRNKAFALGIGRMPSFKKHEISRKEMDDLIVYLKALKKNK